MERHTKHGFILFLLVAIHFFFTTIATAQDSIIIVEVVEGDIEYQRQGWIEPQPLLPGTVINYRDSVFSDDATLLGVCPDGNTRVFTTSEIQSEKALQCPESGELVAPPGRQIYREQRGDSEDYSNPYLISPRRTAVRTAQPIVRWNAVSNVLYYTLILRSSSGQIKEYDRLRPDEVEQGTFAEFPLPEPLTPDVTYTLTICVRDQDLDEECSSDAGLDSGISLFFTYVPDELLDQQLDIISNSLQPAQALYTQAILLSKPIEELSQTQDPIGYYNEAIDNLIRLGEMYPDDPLVMSPAYATLLGDLYRRIDLPRSAARVFAELLPEPDHAFPIPGTEFSSLAALGRAMTTLGDNNLEFYQRAVDDMQSYLTEEAFYSQFQDLCPELGGACQMIQQCELTQFDCATWLQESE